MTPLIFDHDVTDTIRPSPMKVSVCVFDGSDLQINIMPADVCWPRITFFLGAAAANELGHILLAASTHGKAAAPAGWESIETTAD